jgi:Rrf2 family protein
MLSQKAKYALRALLVLAEHYPSERPMAVAEIARAERMSRKFLEAILVELRDADILESRLGRGGGYRLARRPVDVNFGEVIRAIDGPLALLQCASRTQFKACADCRDVATCRIRWAMLKARDAIAGALEGCSLADALKDHGRIAAIRPSHAHPTRKRPPRRVSHAQ